MQRSTSILGFDLGGTKSAAALYDAATLSELAHERLPTRSERGMKAVLEDAVSMIGKLRTKDTVALGIGVPGLVRQPEGTLVTAHNIPGSEGFPVKAFLEERLGMPVAVGNDANCFALAEAVAGAGEGHSVVLGITLGTGVGGGIVVDGRVFQGANGFAGEIGHMLLRPGEPPYETDDKRGDVEQFLSGTSMGKRCTAAKRPEDYLEGEVCSFLRPEIAREAAWMIASATHLLDPSIVVLGGSAGQALRPLLPAIRKELALWLLHDTPLPAISIAVRKDAGTLGAALLTRSGASGTDSPGTSSRGRAARSPRTPRRGGGRAAPTGG